ncbi:MAG: efflux RND transporter periplasmic adaptor subunit [Candidatus Omnitrophica bacterium]|nr:efflux RND transporter periplasmic adaptor subunit [Candidatus Omnitrophota bacterium]
MKRKIKVFLLLIFVFAGLVLIRLATTSNLAKTPVTMRGAVEKVTVKVVAVKREDLDLILSYVGSIKAKDEINVFSKVTGKLVEFTVSEGDKVEKGQGIALIDRDETGLKYELAKVESPLTGIVGRTLLDKGATVLPSGSTGTPLAIVVNMDEMIVKLNIPEPDIAYIKKGLKAQVKVDAYPKDSFDGEISKVSEVVDSQMRTLPIEVTIPNLDHRLKSGMFCRINLIAAKIKDALVLSQDAVVQELGANYVFIVQDHAAQKKKVTLGAQEDNRVQILEGVNEADRIIIFGQQGLKDGSAVEIAEE